ncbi:hypothetical protein EJ357_37225 [Streptomyces cyaneochromogenes]|uniref:Uncharacterized protein n=1 Tax=Streptomyces cyaneochromogenes TaxID=2496836 RepID=A0A3S9MGU9_9ACTN|nr:hypothetical protein [Streptomyces cyaneochromogenes]AZQ38403.1 hypothetical protein EJ357_37225 [Streptomyces cyaneochromogenes]
MPPDRAALGGHVELGLEAHLVVVQVARDRHPCALAGQALRTAHVADYRGLFDRFSLDLGQCLPDAARSSPAPTR